MIERGKFRSLTLINWNGFFARTFDLDELVTTLSGGKCRPLSREPLVAPASVVLRKCSRVRSGISAVTKAAMVVDLPAPLPPESVVTSSSRSKALPLLHFRNTTEAGATSGSREKGLHGKLKAGVCYSVLDVINSRHQRVVVGVRLQQVAGRDRKALRSRPATCCRRTPTTTR